MKHAIIVTGGKQYRVAEGDVIFVEKLDVAAGESVKFDQVLAVVDGETAVFGAPVVEGASITANVVKSGKAAKVTASGGTVTTTGLYGIVADSAASGEDVVIYLTGEFFADKLALESGVTAADLEVAFRNIGIFLKGAANP